MNKELLKKMLTTCSPSGREDQLIKLVLDDTKDLADSHIYDNQGSLTVVYNKESDFKVMLVAHADEISLVVNGYNSNGTLTLTNNGGIKAKLYNGVKVKILVGEKIIHGVIGVVNKDNLSVEDLFVDIGISDPLESQKIVPLGSYVVHDTDVVDLQNDMFAGRALDDRLGVFIIQEASKLASKTNKKIGIYATCSAGEETTGRGAYSSSAIIKPNLSVIVDVTYATDYLGSNASGSIKLHEGGVICLGSIPNRKLNNLLEECAKELNLPIQYEVYPGRTSTDADTIIKTNEGVPQVLFSIPLRYMHSPIEVASYKDVESMIQILALFLNKISKDYSLTPFNF